MTKTYVVRSRFDADGLERWPGEIVDAGDWKWRDELIDQGRLEADPEDMDPVVCVCDREWQNADFAEHCPTCGGELTSEEPEDSEGPPEDISGLKKAELQDIADEMGLEPEGTGAAGQVLKDDLKRAIEEARE